MWGKDDLCQQHFGIGKPDDNWPSRPEKAEMWASMGIKLTRNKIIALIETWILKAKVALKTDVQSGSKTGKMITNV